MSDRIIVMWKGEIAQEGKPGDIYRYPQSSFVADFIGRSNLIAVQGFDRLGNGAEVRLGSEQITLISTDMPDTEPPRFCCIRPENVRVLVEGPARSAGENRLDGILRRIVNLGPQLDLSIEIAPDVVLSAIIPSSHSGLLPTIGERLQLSIAAGDVRLLSS